MSKNKKYVVYMKNNFCLMGKEYMKNNGDNTVTGFHNPALADHFESKPKAKALQDRLKYDTFVTELQPELDAFANTNWVYRKTPMLDDTINVPYDSKSMSKIDVLKWRKEATAKRDCTISDSVYSSYPRLSSLFTYLWDLCSYTKTGSSQYMYSCQIRTSKAGVFNEFKEEFDLVLDYTTYVDENGYKVFPIFEHTLSAGGSYYLKYKSDVDCKICSSYRDGISKSLKECFEEIRRSYWYE